MHVRTDGTHAVHDSGNQRDQQEDGKEEQEMSEATIIIIFAAFLFGVIMGLCLGKANK